MTLAERRTRAKKWREWFPDLGVDLWFGSRAMGPLEVAMLSTETAWVVALVEWPSHVVDSWIDDGHGGLTRRAKQVADFAAEPFRREVVCVSESKSEAEAALEVRMDRWVRARAPRWRQRETEHAPDPEQLPLLGLDKEEPRRE